MYAALQWCTTNYAPIGEEVRELLGAGPFQMPADISVVNDDDMREAFETYWSVPGQSATERMKFMKFRLGPARLRLCRPVTPNTKNSTPAPQFVNVAYSFLNCPWEDMRGLVDAQMGTYDVPKNVRQAGWAAE